MTARFALELLGYLATALIAASLLMRSIVRLRFINMLGGATFSLYGFLIGAYPVGILNMLTAGINAVQLFRLRKRQEFFRILELSPDSQYLRYFLELRGSDIRKFQPHFDPQTKPSGLALFVLRDLAPAGLFMGVIRGQTLEVQLDYVLPQYRDLKVARFLFCDEVDFFRKRGIREIVSAPGNDEHQAYLRRMGFEPVGEWYRLGIE